MTERSSATVPIIVAVIGVVGTITTALIANWDKIAGGRADPPAAQQPVQPNGAAPPPAVDRADAIVSPTVPVAIDVAGTWVDAEGYEYEFEQTGTHYRFRQLKNGTQIGSGDGSLVGASFSHRFTGVFGDGRCAGQLSNGGNVSSGTCTNGPNTWDFRVVRKMSIRA